MELLSRAGRPATGLASSFLDAEVHEPVALPQPSRPERKREAGKSRGCSDDHANDDALHGDEDNEDEEDDDGVEALRSDDEFGGAETTGGTDEALERSKMKTTRRPTKTTK